MGPQNQPTNPNVRTTTSLDGGNGIVNEGLRQRKNKLSAKPINSLQSIDRVRKLLRFKPRDALLFELAIQSGLPITHLLNLKVKDLHKLEVGERLSFTSEAINRGLSVTINNNIRQAFNSYLEQLSPSEDDYLFKSRKGSNPLSIGSVSRLVKGWFKAVNLKDLNGILSLRKTGEYHRQAKQLSGLVPYGETNMNQLLKPLQIPTRQEMVYKELEKAIISGRIPPGERLVVEEVARQMSVSHIPVREAFGKLEARGFILTIEKRGNVVNELSRARLKEILELRLMLEGLAAEGAAVRCSEETISQVEALHEQYALARNGSDADELLRINMDFHLAVYKDSNMPTLQELIISLWGKVSPYYHIFFRQAEKPNPRAGIAYHQEIINALRNHDAEGVRRWTEADLKDSARFILELFDIYSVDYKI
jgi:DNA-binding GntR family transcriptional regulator